MVEWKNAFSFMVCRRKYLNILGEVVFFIKQQRKSRISRTCLFALCAWRNRTFSFVTGIFISEIAQGYGRNYSRLALGSEREESLLVYKLPKSFTNDQLGYSCTVLTGGSGWVTEEVGMLEAWIMVGRFWGCCQHLCWVYASFRRWERTN